MRGVEAQADIVIFRKVIQLGVYVAEGGVGWSQQVVPHRVFTKTLCRACIRDRPGQTEPVGHAAGHYDDDSDK